jgi:HAD superfamily 5'-nucleotidase-like hydrolase
VSHTPTCSFSPSLMLPGSLMIPQYDFALRSLARRGVPTQGLQIDKDLVIRGLIIDKRHGNIVKTDRFGFVKRAMHGTARMSAAEVRTRYGRELVNLKDEERWVFLNTFFSVSEAVLYAQLVDRLDSGAIERTVCPRAYDALHALVKEAVFDAHVEGTLKQEIMANPSRFVRPDPELPQTLIDQRQAGKTLMLITNSEFDYTATVMTCALGSGWKSYFDIIIVNARKPDFWSSDAQLYEIVSDDGLMRPVQKLTRQSDSNEGKIFSGGSAKQVQAALGVEGSSVLYVGDHIYTDAALAKLQFSWRTCLILRELEAEVQALASGRAHRQYLKSLLDKKERVGFCLNQIRLERQRILARPDGELVASDFDRIENFNRVLAELLVVMSELDDQIGPGIERDGCHFNATWGHLCRAGVNDRSMLLKQIEKYADVYTSKVSNLGLYSPYMYWRAPPVSMGHDRPKKDETVLGVNPASSRKYDS